MTLLEQEIVERASAPSGTPCDRRFLFYSHDGLGLGHTRRHLAIARALIELAPESSVLLATGSEVVNRLGLTPPIDMLKLPGLRKVGNEEYAPRRLRIPASEIRALRSALLHATIKAYRPAVALVDKHPFGAKGELRAGLKELRAAGGRAVLGLRDILDDPAHVRKEWSGERIWERMAGSYDLVLVYGERAVFDPVVEYGFPEAVAARTHFCGYVMNRDESDPAAEAPSAAAAGRNGAGPRVLATAGGGEDGFALLQTFMRAADRESWEGIAVAGPMSPALKALGRLAARANVTLHTFVPSLSLMFQHVDALVCMGGYNTLVEAVSKGVPTVCVPRTSPRREQLIRARAFERLGLLTVIEPERLDPENLGRAVHSLIGSGPQALIARGHAALNFDGARQAASELLALASARPGREATAARNVAD